MPQRVWAAASPPLPSEALAAAPLDVRLACWALLGPLSDLLGVPQWGQCTLTDPGESFIKNPEEKHATGY